MTADTRAFEYRGLGDESWAWEKLRRDQIAENNSVWAQFTAHKLPVRDTRFLNREPLPCRAHFEKTGEDLWFDEATAPTDTPGEHGRTRRRAKQICFACPVRERCLKDAIDRMEDHGIWGGLSVNDRRRLRAELKAREAVA